MAKDSSFYDSVFINTATTTVVRSAPGALIAVTIGTTAAGLITIYDNASVGSGKVLAEFKSSIAEGNYVLNLIACLLYTSPSPRD